MLDRLLLEARAGVGLDGPEVLAAYEGLQLTL
jgi:hypothetical protein